MDQNPPEQENEAKVVTPEKLVEILANTYDEVVFQRANTVYMNLDELDYEYDAETVSSTKEDAKLLTEQIKTINRIARRALQGEPIQTRVLGREIPTEILDLPTSEHK